MSVTAFFSMWLSNTATTAMMFPIAQAVLHELKEGTQTVNGTVNKARSFEMEDSSPHANEKIPAKEDSNSCEDNEKFSDQHAEIIRYECSSTYER